MKKYEENVAQLIRRLVDGDHHTAKGASCSIIPGVYPSKSFFIFPLSTLSFSVLTQLPK